MASLTMTPVVFGPGTKQEQREEKTKWRSCSRRTVSVDGALQATRVTFSSITGAFLPCDFKQRRP